MSGCVSVVIAEDCLLVRDSVYRALSTDADVTVVGVGEDYDSTVDNEFLNVLNPSIPWRDLVRPFQQP